MVLSGDRCMLGMQVRKQRRRHAGGQSLPALPKIEERHFREVKTGVATAIAHYFSQIKSRPGVASSAHVRSPANRQPPLDCVHGWKPPDSICWRCSAPWAARI